MSKDFRSASGQVVAVVVFSKYLNWVNIWQQAKQSSTWFGPWTYTSDYLVCKYKSPEIIKDQYMIQYDSISSSDSSTNQTIYY